MNWLVRCVIVLSVTLARVGNAADLSGPQVEASYVFNFIKFAEWPAGAVRGSRQVTLCVVGSKSIGQILGDMDGRQIGRRTLHVVPNVGAEDDLRGCQALYLGASVQQHLSSVVRALGDAPVLTISSIAGFAQKGGCIGLTYRENKMRFEINLAAARKARLRLPSQVLNLASNVYTS